MKTLSNRSINMVFFACFLLLLLCAGEVESSSRNKSKVFNPHEVEIPYVGMQFVNPIQRPKTNDRWEPYIPRTINYGLSFALPSNIHRGLELDAGWDQWNSSATFKLDYFQPLKVWNDKSVFLSPRISLDSGRESFSMGAGIRTLLTSETMVGFHAFHDWVRPRRMQGEYLRETVIGLELSSLPGYFSDLRINANAYIPINVRQTLMKEGVSLFRESLPAGGDIRVSFLAPPVFPYFDIRLEGQAHSYRATNTNLTGHKASIAVNSRDGMLNANFQYGRDSSWGEHFTLMAGINLAFDWNEAIKLNNPFSAPYKTLDKRYNRKIRESLYSKVSRRHDLPLDRSEVRSTLMASISGETVTFTGGFPDIPNSVVTVQVSQSPWRDCMEVPTDENGSYYGMLSLPPGTCKLRLVHKPSGRATEARTVMIAENPEGQDVPLETNSWRLTPEF